MTEIKKDELTKRISGMGTDQSNAEPIKMYYTVIIAWGKRLINGQNF